jgi:hypothetical protein
VSHDFMTSTTRLQQFQDESVLHELHKPRMTTNYIRTFSIGIICGR